MNPITPEISDRINAALGKPASQALDDLQPFRTNIDVIREIREREVTGRARWQVLHQMRQWASELGQKL